MPLASGPDAKAHMIHAEASIPTYDHFMHVLGYYDEHESQAVQCGMLPMENNWTLMINEWFGRLSATTNRKPSSVVCIRWRPMGTIPIPEWFGR